MKLDSFQVRCFRNVLDSTPIAVDKGGHLPGRQERVRQDGAVAGAGAGEPPYNEPFDDQRDYPRWRLVAPARSTRPHRSRRPSTSTPTIARAVEAVWGPGVLVGETFGYARTYGGGRRLDVALNEPEAVRNLLGRLDSLVARFLVIVLRTLGRRVSGSGLVGDRVRSP